VNNDLLGRRDDAHVTRRLMRFDTAQHVHVETGQTLYIMRKDHNRTHDGTAIRIDGPGQNGCLDDLSVWSVGESSLALGRPHCS
jgi:hypothetical protein